jgi:HK97 gp10 family phage protein
MADVLIDGVKELEKRLEKIDRKIADKVLRSATSKGLDPIKRRAKSNCQWPSIKKLIGKKVWKNKKKQITGKVYLRPTKDGRTIELKGKTVGFEAVGQILEFGRKKGDLKPRPFMRPAREQAKAAALKAMAEEGEKRLAELVKKVKIKTI